MKTDVLILGGGLAAMTAADRIVRDSNLRVTLLRWGSGASPYIHGFCMPLGEGDSMDLLAADTMASGCGQSDPALVETLCRGTAELPAFFASLGVDMDRQNGTYRLLHALGSSVPRIASIENSTGPALLSRLRKHLKESGRYEEMEHCRALSLVKEGGRVAGARCYDKSTDSFFTVASGVVVLATGGFGRLFPQSSNSSDIGGDGIAMAYDAGAALTDLEFIQFEPSSAVWPESIAGKGIITTMLYDGAVLRGADGRRFMLDKGYKSECVPKDVLAKCIYREMDEHGTTPHGGVWFDATGVPGELWQGAYRPYLNRYLACGIDLRKTPVEIAPAAHSTCGGVVVDRNCYTGVPGLLACGEVTGGLHGASRLGGNAGLETMVFGLRAGREAAARYEPAPDLPEDRRGNPRPSLDAEPIRRELEEILRECLNVVRRGETMEAGLRRLEALLENPGLREEAFETMRLRNDFLTAWLALRSARERRGSVGCHCRADGVPEDRPYRLLLRRGSIGCTVRRERL